MGTFTLKTSFNYRKPPIFFSWRRTKRKERVTLWENGPDEEHGWRKWLVERFFFLFSGMGLTTTFWVVAGGCGPHRRRQRSAASASNFGARWNYFYYTYESQMADVSRWACAWRRECCSVPLCHRRASYRCTQHRWKYSSSFLTEEEFSSIALFLKSVVFVTVFPFEIK